MKKGNPFTQRDTEKVGDPDVQDAAAGREDENPGAEGKAPESRPWEPKGATTAPWNPDLLRVTKAEDDDMHLRWVREDNVDRKLQEGYKLAEGSKYKITPNESGRIQRRELVLMEIPNEYVEMRENNKEALARKLNEDSRRSVDETAKRAGVRVTEEE